MAEITAPTLLIVGGNDWVVLEHNRRAAQLLRCTNHLAVVPGATHFFEEPGSLDQTTEIAIDWFTRYLPPASPSESRLVRRRGPGLPQFVLIHLWSGELTGTDREIFSAHTPADIMSVRAKSGRHGNSAADKWSR